MENPEDFKPPKATPEEIADVEVLTPTLLKMPKAGGAQGKDGGMVKGIVVSIIVTLAIVLGMGAMGGGVFVTKSQFDDNWVGMQASIVTSVSDIGQLKKTVSNAVEGLPNLVTTQIGNSITQAVGQTVSQINDISAKVTGNTSKLTDYETRIGALEAENDTLEARITELETGTGGDGVADGEVTIDVNYVSQEYISLTPGATAIIDFPVKLTIENLLTTDIEDVVVIMDASTRTGDVNLAITSVSIYGSAITWYSYGAGYFESWDLSVDALDKDKYSFSIRMEVVNNHATDTITNYIYLKDLEVEIDDYGIAN